MGWVNLKRKAYNEIYSCNSLNVYMCLTAAYIITDGSHWWQIGIAFIKRYDSKITTQLANPKTTPQSTMPTGSEHVVGPSDAPY